MAEIAPKSVAKVFFDIFGWPSVGNVADRSGVARSLNEHKNVYSARLKSNPKPPSERERHHAAQGVRAHF